MYHTSLYTTTAICKNKFHRCYAKQILHHMDITQKFYRYASNGYGLLWTPGYVNPMEYTQYRYITHVHKSLYSGNEAESDLTVFGRVHCV